MKNVKLTKNVIAVTGILGALAGAFLPLTANAAPVAYAACDVNGSIASAPTAPTTQTCGLVTDPGYAKADLGSLSATANVNGNPNPYNTYGADASVNYFVTLSSSTGVYGSGQVPLSISANLLTQVGGGNANDVADVALAHISISDFINTYYQSNACAGWCTGRPGDGQPSLSGTNLFYIPANNTASGFGPNTYMINLSAGSGVWTEGVGYAHALADPYIQIDPTFQAAHPEYSLTFSPNITNAPVPIPATAWLFGSGLLGLIGMARRKAGRRVQ